MSVTSNVTLKKKICENIFDKLLHDNKFMLIFMSLKTSKTNIMKTFEKIYTTKSGHNVFVVRSPKNQDKVAMYIGWDGADEDNSKRTDAVFYSDETIEDYVFMVSSSTGLKLKDDHIAVANAVAEYLK
jgi:hypothetical protein